jgi:dipeptidyl aminopeptidase/acylaminoacyl peptidase
MPASRRLAACLAACAFMLAGCAAAPRHPALVQAEAAGTLAPLVPLRRFIANVDFAGGFALSPDGQSLLWSRVVGTDLGLAVRPVAGGEERSFRTGYLARPAGPTYTWLPDSRHVAYLKDLRGDENTQIHVFDTQGPFAPWAVTPWPGVRSTLVSGGAEGTAKFFFASNRRDRATMDLYEADAATRSVREVARSDGEVLAWIIGTDHRLAARIRQLGRQDGSDVAFELLQADGAWKALRTVGGWDSLQVHRVDGAAGKAWAASNAGRDKSALVEIDLASGRETVLAEHPVVDLSWVYYPRLRGGPIAYITDAGVPQVHFLDAAFAALVAQAQQQALRDGALQEAPRLTRPQSSSLDGRRWVLRAIGDHDEAELLVDSDTGAVQRLDPPEPERKAWLAAEEAYSFRASDGREIHGYLIRPRGVRGPAPLVVDIHGGPGARDRWNPASFNFDQMLANRGYAVLNVNYRGSTGYGRDYMMAGRKVVSTRLQQDIAEAAQWAIDQGIADPSRMAVVGASFGGFSVLSQLIRKDHDWNCGVDIVGVANWPRVIENWPPYWRGRHYAEAFYGDVKDPQERARMLEESPISHLDRITAPLLVIHGANDVRVVRQDSDDVVATLRQLGRPVEYLSFPDEGHQVRRWRNRLAMWRRIEDSLAACLGGRSAGWDFYELVPR